MTPYDRAVRAREAIRVMDRMGTHAEAIGYIEKEIREAVEDCQIVERKKKPEFFCDKCGYMGPIRQRHPRPNEPGWVCNYEAGPLPEAKCSCDQDVHTPCPIHYATECSPSYPGYKPQPVREDFEQQEARIAHNRKAESNHLKRQVQTANNLLAVMHRDGGHHTGEHGFIQSCLDAEKRYYEMVREIAALKGIFEKVTALAYQVIDGVTGDQKKHVGSIIKLCDKDLADWAKRAADETLIEAQQALREDIVSRLKAWRTQYEGNDEGVSALDAYARTCVDSAIRIVLDNTDICPILKREGMYKGLRCGKTAPCPEHDAGSFAHDGKGCDGPGCIYCDDDAEANATCQVEVQDAGPARQVVCGKPIPCGDHGGKK